MSKKHLRPLKTPVYRDSGFRLEDAGTTARAFSSELQQEPVPSHYIYSRYRNPTVVAVEDQLMRLESSAWALLTQSGMAAIDTALGIFHQSADTGNWLFFSEIYGGTNTYIDEVLIRRRGIRAERLCPEHGSYGAGIVRKAMKKFRPRVVFLETVSNPMLMVNDIPLIISIAKEFRAAVLVDNTFATPYLFRPLDHGADLVIHSATKYLSGHGSLTAGVLCGNNPAFAQQAVAYRKVVGHMLSPDDASRLGEQLKTFRIRMEKHCTNASLLAEFLEAHPMVERTIYPGLSSHPDHGLAERLFKGKGFGGMISFELSGKSPDNKRKICNRLIKNLSEHIPLIPSLGDADSTLLPVEPVWGDKYPYPGLIRLSVGIEPVNDLLDLFREALESL